MGTAWMNARAEAFERLGGKYEVRVLEPSPPAPPTLVETRVALHRLTALVLSPARGKVNGKIALRYTRGGFGTPFYGDDVQLRVEGDGVVIQGGGPEKPCCLAMSDELRTRMNGVRPIHEPEASRPRD